MAARLDVGAKGEHGDAGLLLVDGAAVELGAVFVEGFAVVGADEEVGLGGVVGRRDVLDQAR